MRRLTIHLPILIFILVFNSGNCQVQSAQKEMSVFNYSQAIIILQKTIDKEKQNPDPLAMSLLAECYRKQNDIPNSLLWYKKIISSGRGEPLTFFYYAQALRSSGEYAEAKKMFMKYDSIVPGDRQASLFSAYCDSAIVWMSKSPGYEIKNVSSLNTPQSEFGVSLYEKGLLFSSDRVITQININVGRVYGWTGNNYLQIFYAEHGFPDSSCIAFRTPELFEDFANPDGHNGPASYDKVNDELFINRTVQVKDKGRKESDHIRTHLLKIFTSSGKDGKWSEPEPFFINSESYSVGHPSVSADGNTLYFVSDMPGGYGGTDIYVCTREKGSWSNPVNLGEKINTGGNEMFPHLSESGDLYFASDGHPGFGGLDLFVVTMNSGKWTRPVNLGYPVNSSYDDFSVFLMNNDQKGYFSSNRPGGKGNDDIYFFSKKVPPSPSLPPPLSYVTGCVKEKSTLQPIRGAFVFIHDNKSGKVLILKTDTGGCFRTPVKKASAYLVKAIFSGYIPDCLSFIFDSTNQLSELALPRDLLLDRLEINKTYQLTNIYYNFDRWNIRQDAKPSLNELVRIMKENPVNVELGSHTDCRGSYEYNQVLSQKRAESAVQYIISQGIDSLRITAKGYGKLKLVNKCSCEKGISCSEEEHQQNRRTEFRIVSFSDHKTSTAIDTTPFRSGDVIDIRELPEEFYKNCK